MSNSAVFRVRWIPALVTLFVSSSLPAVDVPAVFSDHAVLQRDMPLPVWGTAEPGSDVSVEFAGQRKRTRVANDGRWSVTLDPMPASADGRTMTIAGSDGTLEVKDVLIGEVWLCGGQSNMAWPVHASNNADAEIAAGNAPWLRRIKAPHAVSRTPAGDIEASWVVSSSATVGNFTAVGTFMARRLHEQLGVPIGLLDINWGGTRAEPWTPIAAMKTHPRFRERIDDADAATREIGRSDPGVMFNAMLRPFIPYGIRGAIWYQGESNSKQPDEYASLLPLMIRSWREAWGQGDFPFGIVQLAAFKAVSDDPVQGGWASLRDAQDLTHRLVRNTGLVVLIDVGDARNIHPGNKQAVGTRLADWALNRCHGRDDLPESGPFYRSHSVDGDAIVVHFDHVGDGLTGRRGKPVDGFAILGSDGQWHWADVEVVGVDRLRVSHPDAMGAKAVRYAWQDNPVRANLVSGDGLPAAPFKTD